jgi:hypothetical protein
MALIDAQNEFSDAQAVTVTAASTNSIDLVTTIPQYAGTENLFVLAKVNTAFAGGTSIAVSIETDDNSSFSSAATPITGATVLTAAATAGTTLLRVDLGGLTLERYLRLKYTIVGTMSAGNVDAFLHVTDDLPGGNLS